MDEQAGSNVVSVGVDLSEFYMSVEWDILEVPAVRYIILYYMYLFIHRPREMFREFHKRKRNSFVVLIWFACCLIFQRVIRKCCLYKTCGFITLVWAPIPSFRNVEHCNWLSFETFSWCCALIHWRTFLKYWFFILYYSLLNSHSENEISVQTYW